MADEGLPARSRLRQNREFQRVFRNRKSVADRVLVVYACPSDLPHSRLGMSVSRKVGNATSRNRWKRLIRDAFRRHRNEIPAGMDFVVLPRKGVQPTHSMVVASLVHLTNRAARGQRRRRKS